MKGLTRLLTACALPLLSWTANATESPQRQLVTIASGSSEGIYFQVASEICRLTSARKATHGIRCGAIPTDGSQENLSLLLSGEVDFALVQSDVLYYAAQAYPTKFKALMATHAEPLTLVTRPDTEIKTVPQLTGKTLNIGAPESGTNQSVKKLSQRVSGWQTPPALKEEAAEDAFESLCLGEIDAYAAIIGHPNRLVNKTSKRCDITFISVSADTLRDKNGLLPPYLVAGYIPGRLYRGNKAKTPTLAYTANLITLADTDPALVKAVAASVLAKEKVFGDNISAWANVFRKKEYMTGDAVVIPLHPDVHNLLSAAE